MHAESSCRCSTCRRVECLSPGKSGQIASSSRKPQGGTSWNENLVGDSRDEVQTADQAGKTVDMVKAEAEQSVSSDEGLEGTVGRRRHLRQRTGRTERKKSRDGSKKNCSTRRNIGSKGEGRWRRVVARGRKGWLGQKAEESKGVGISREV